MNSDGCGPQRLVEPAAAMLHRVAMAEGDVFLDLRGLKCPQPVLRTRRALKRLPPGAVLRLECTDPLAVIDIPHFVRGAGYDLLEAARSDDILIFRIRKPG